MVACFVKILAGLFGIDSLSPGSLMIFVDILAVSTVDSGGPIDPRLTSISSTYIWSTF